MQSSSTIAFYQYQIVRQVFGQWVALEPHTKFKESMLKKRQQENPDRPKWKEKFLEGSYFIVLLVKNLKYRRIKKMKRSGMELQDGILNTGLGELMI